MTERGEGPVIVTSAKRWSASWILASRDRAAALEAKTPRERTELMKNFLGLPGSLTYRRLHDGSMKYRISRAVAG